jgi:hypothetical protein
MRRSLNLNRLDFWFIVNIQNLDKPKVYKKRFRTKNEAMLAKDKFLGNVRVGFLQGFFLVNTQYSVLPFKAPILTESEKRKSSPYQRKRTRHGRDLYNKFKDLSKLKGPYSKGQILNTLVKLLG